MNCKPGDLAIVIRDGRVAKVAGRVVEVLYATPGTHFRLPDGVWHEPCNSQSWVCHFPGSAVPVWNLSGQWRETNYASVADCYLRPLPGNTEPAETTTELEAQ